MRIVVVDANRIMSALLGGVALRILNERQYQFVIPIRTTWEVMRYMKLIAGKSGKVEEELLATFHEMPLEAVGGDAEYLHRFVDVERLGLRDPNDRDCAALALHLNAPVWTYDKDLTSLAGIETVSDRDLLPQGEPGE